jgi:hypothetical protein
MATRKQFLNVAIALLTLFPVLPLAIFLAAISSLPLGLAFLGSYVVSLVVVFAAWRNFQNRHERDAREDALAERYLTSEGDEKKRVEEEISKLPRTWKQRIALVVLMSPVVILGTWLQKLFLFDLPDRGITPSLGAVIGLDAVLLLAVLCLARIWVISRASADQVVMRYFDRHPHSVHLSRYIEERHRELSKRYGV